MKLVLLAGDSKCGKSTTLLNLEPQLRAPLGVWVPELFPNNVNNFQGVADGNKRKDRFFALSQANKLVFIYTDGDVGAHIIALLRSFLNLPICGGVVKKHSKHIKEAKRLGEEARQIYTSKTPRPQVVFICAWNTSNRFGTVYNSNTIINSLTTGMESSVMPLSESNGWGYKGRSVGTALPLRLLSTNIKIVLDPWERIKERRNRCIVSLI